MPPRIVTAAIVLFWLTTTSMLIYREAAPRFQTGQAPPFTIDLTAEVGANVVNWVVLQTERRVGSGFTQVQRNDQGSYDFNAQFKLEKIKLFGQVFPPIKVLGAYRVSEEGRLLAGSANMKATLLVPVEFDFRGDVREQKFHPTLKLSLDGQDVKLAPLEPFPVSDSGSILNPMHLVHKISGLRAGQTWPIPLMDPLRAVPAAMRDFVPGKENMVSHLLATVTLADLDWNGHAEPCFKIAYAKAGDEPLAATWVRQRDAVVLQQWASYEGIEYTLQRAPNQ